RLLAALLGQPGGGVDRPPAADGAARVVLDRLDAAVGVDEQAELGRRGGGAAARPAATGSRARRGAGSRAGARAGAGTQRRVRPLLLDHLLGVLLRDLADLLAGALVQRGVLLGGELGRRQRGELGVLAHVRRRL